MSNTNHQQPLNLQLGQVGLSSPSSLSFPSPTGSSASTASSTSSARVNEVAEHYNRRDGGDLVSRSKSRIYYLRNFNNWIKSVLISEHIKKLRNNDRLQNRLAVLDLGCGKGGDLLKWTKSNVSHVTFTDIAEKSLEECKKRLGEQRSQRYTTRFFCMDATEESIKKNLLVFSEDKHKEVDDKKEEEEEEKKNQQKKPEYLQHDLVSSQFVIHYSFESQSKADQFLRNVSDSLTPGGYFIGTTTNANEIVRRFKQLDGEDAQEFGNDLYKIRFFEPASTLASQLFGVKFDFQLGFAGDEVVNVPEFLLNFDVLQAMAERHGLELVLKQPFDEFFADHADKSDYKVLINIIRALEPVFPNSDEKSKFDSADGEYAAIGEKLKDEAFRANLRDDEQYLTLSKSEWEVIQLYLVFAFQKKKEEKKEKTNDGDEKRKNSSTTGGEVDNGKFVPQKRSAEDSDGEIN